MYLGKYAVKGWSYTMIRFGVDRGNPKNIGLAPDVLPIEQEDVYFGVKTCDKSTRERRKEKRHGLLLPVDM